MNECGEAATALISHRLPQSPGRWQTWRPRHRAPGRSADAGRPLGGSSPVPAASVAASTKTTYRIASVPLKVLARPVASWDRKFVRFNLFSRYMFIIV